MTESKRGKKVAIFGTVLQVAIAGAMLALWLATKSLAAMAATWVLAGGVLLWLMVAVLFYCRQLVNQEQAQLDEIASRGQGGTIFGGEDELAARPAAARLHVMERWVVPIFTLLWAAGHAAVGVMTISTLAAIDRPLTLIRLGPAALFTVLIAFMSFLFSRYCTGMGTQRQWRLLRAAGSYLLVNVVLITGVLIAMLAATQTYARADRIIALLAPAVQLLLAAELALNIILDLYRPRVPGQEERPPFDSRLFNLVAQPGRVGHTIAETLNYQFGFEVSKTWFYQLLSRAFGPLVILGAVVMFLMSTNVIVPEGHEGIVYRFGSLPPEPTDGSKRETLGPGISLKWPWPIDRVEMFNTGQVYEIMLGTGEERGGEEDEHDDGHGHGGKDEHDESFINGHRMALWTSEHGDHEELNFLVAVPPERRHDENGQAPGKKDPPSVHIIKLVVPVHYRIEDPYAFSRAARDGHGLLASAAYREMVRYCASASLTEQDDARAGKRPEAIMTSGRGAAAKALKDRLQNVASGLGIRIVHVGLMAVHPPAEVAPEFEKVLQAERAQDEKRFRAEAEANRLLAAVAGTPDEARKLALAIRVLDTLQELDNSRNRPADQTKLLNGYRSRARGDLADVDKVIARSQGARRAAMAAYRVELQEYLTVLDTLAKSPGTFDYAGQLDRARARTDQRFDRAAGQPARLVAEAMADRWEKELKERSRSEAFRWQLAAYTNSPEVYRTDRWLGVWDQILPNIRKYVLAVDRDKVEVWLNLEKQEDPMGGALSGAGTGE